MRNVVITGGSRGIGLATAKQFCQHGDAVLIVSRSNEKLSEAKSTIQSDIDNATISTYSADCSVKEDIDELVEHINNKFGGCDILINNAGVFIPGAIHEEDEGNFEQMMKTNLHSAYHLTRSLLPQLQHSNHADIVNICSIASITAYANGGSYAISKAAMLSFSKNLREELKEDGIRVISVLPGATYTDSWAGVDIDEQRLMPASDIALLISTACNLSRRSVMEEVVIRPQLGDL